MKHEKKKNKEDPLLMEEHYTATRIDHIIITPNVINKILKSNIIQKHYIHTDHNPIECTIQINGKITSTFHMLFQFLQPCLFCKTFHILTIHVPQLVLF